MFSGLNDTLVTNCYCVLLVVLWLVFRMMRGMARIDLLLDWFCVRVP